MKASSYIQMPERANVKLERAFKTECCDCGLVHLWVLKMKKGEPFFEIVRDNRATGQRRRASNGEK